MAVSRMTYAEENRLLRNHEPVVRQVLPPHVQLIQMGRSYIVSRAVYAAAKLGLAKIAPHDLRRSCARLCHAAGGEMEPIQFLLGHVSAQTTEKYLGSKQRLSEAVDDRIGIEPECRDCD